MRCSPAVRPRVQDTRTRPVESVVRMLSSTLPCAGSSVTATPGTGFLARSSTRSSTSGFSTLLTDPSRLATATSGDGGGTPGQGRRSDHEPRNCARASDLHVGPLGTGLGTQGPPGPGLTQRVGSRLGGHDASVIVRRPRDRNICQGHAARIRHPNDHRLRQRAAGRTLEMLAHLRQAGVGTDRLGFGGDDRVAGHSFGADRQRLTPRHPAQRPGRPDDALSIGGGRTGDRSRRHLPRERTAPAHPRSAGHCATRPEPPPGWPPAVPPVPAVHRRRAASARRAPDTPPRAAGSPGPRTWR